MQALTDLYIIGAGCSRNYSQSTELIHGLKSPLNSDFFKMAYRVITNTGMQYDSLFMDEITNLIFKVAPLYGYKGKDLEFFRTSGIQLEEVMTLLDIEERLFTPFTNPQLRSAESRELRTVKELLVRTLDYALKGPQCVKHKALAQKMQDSDIVLSFNYDILLDNALLSLNKLTDSGYKVNFSKVNLNGKWIQPVEKFSPITLLKLHGSLNWIRCGFCGALFLYQFKKQVLIGAEDFHCPRCSSGETYARRMVIPPVQSKEYADRDIAYLWALADKLLKDLNRVICIGYSFPASDFDITSLIRRCRRRQSKMPDIAFVNPDLKAKKRFENLFGKKLPAIKICHNTYNQHSFGTTFDFLLSYQWLQSLNR